MTDAQPMTYDAEMEHRFKFHPADSDTALRHERVRDECHRLAAVVTMIVPAGREQALAVTKVEEAMMWANAGLARNNSRGPADGKVA